MDALPARHRLTRMQSDALLSLSEQLVQLERRFDDAGDRESMTVDCRQR